MSAPLTLIKALKEEPYRSIINLLIEIDPVGLTLKTMQYALLEEHALSIVGKQQTYFDKTIEDLTQARRFRKYKIKVINRIKDEGKIEKIKNERRAKNVTLNFLNRLKRINVVYKDGHHYKIDKRVCFEELQIQNKEAISFFPRDKMMPWKVKDRTNVLYGLSKEVYNKFNDEEKKAFQIDSEQLEKSITNIEKSKIRVLTREIKERINTFIDKTSSEKIKKALNEFGGYNFWVSAQHVLILKSEWNPSGIWHVGSVDSISEDVFYEAMGWLSEGPRGEYLIKRQKHVHFEDSLPNVLYGEDLCKFFSDVPDGRIPRSEVDRYCRLWSERFFSNDYGFSLEEIEELIKWGWDNRDLFFDFYPLSIAFSSFEAYRPDIRLSEFQFMKLF